MRNARLVRAFSFAAGAKWLSFRRHLGHVCQASEGVSANIAISPESLAVTYIADSREPLV
jgi:hypothetical protein